MSNDKAPMVGAQRAALRILDALCGPPYYSAEEDSILFGDYNAVNRIAWIIDKEIKNGE